MRRPPPAGRRAAPSGDPSYDGPGARPVVLRITPLPTPTTRPVGRGRDRCPRGGGCLQLRPAGRHEVRCRAHLHRPVHDVGVTADGDRGGRPVACGVPRPWSRGRRPASPPRWPTLRPDRVNDSSPPIGPRDPCGWPGSRTGAVTTTPDPDRRSVRAEVEVRYRVDHLDTADRTTRVAYDLVRSGGGWAVAEEGPVGTAPAPPWLAMPGLRVVRTPHAVVAGTAPESRLEEHAAVVDRALPDLVTSWDGAPRTVLVLAPGTPTEAHTLLGRPAAGGGQRSRRDDRGPEWTRRQGHRRPDRPRPHRPCPPDAGGTRRRAHP